MAEIASAFVSILPSTRGFGRKLESDVGRDIQGSGKKLGSGFGKAFGAAAGVLAAAGIGSLLKDSIASASDLGEELSKSGVIFGKQAGEIEKFAEGAATALGQSEIAALNATSTFGQIAQKAGLGGQATAEFAQTFTKLASDMASFSNTTPEEAIEAIGSAMRGEAEPIRKYGVLLDDATLRNTALKLGIIDSIKQALTPQQKALAASQAILEQTGKATGDFERTSGGLANQQRILTAQFENFKTKLGSAFLPMALKVVRFFNTKMIPVLENFAGFVRETVVPKVQEFASNLRDKLEPALRKAGGYIRDTLIPKLKDFAGEVRERVAPAVRFLRDRFEELRPKAAEFLASVRENFPKVVEKVKQVTASMLELRDKLVLALKPAVDNLANGFRERVAPEFDKLKAQIRQDLKPAIDDLQAAFRDPAVQQLVRGVGKLIGAFIVVTAQMLSDTIPVIAQLGVFISRHVVGSFSAGVRAIGAMTRSLGFVSQATQRGVQAFVEFNNRAGSAINALVEQVRKLPGKVGEALSGLAAVAKSAGEQLISSLVGGVVSKASTLGNAAVAAVQSALARARSAIAGGIPGVGGGDSAGKPSGKFATPFVPSFTPSSDFMDGTLTAVATPRRVVLSVGGREFDGYIDERADGRVSSTHDLSMERSRASWSRSPQ